MRAIAASYVHPLVVSVPILDKGSTSPGSSSALDGGRGGGAQSIARENQAFHLACDFEELVVQPVRGRVSVQGLKQCVAEDLVPGLFGSLATAVSPGGVEVGVGQGKGGQREQGGQGRRVEGREGPERRSPQRFDRRSSLSLCTGRGSIHACAWGELCHKATR